MRNWITAENEATIKKHRRLWCLSAAEITMLRLLSSFLFGGVLLVSSHNHCDVLCQQLLENLLLFGVRKTLFGITVNSRLP
jgi:hypothetical protein